jgi:hypothetical protein
MFNFVSQEYGMATDATFTDKQIILQMAESLFC